MNLRILMVLASVVLFSTPSAYCQGRGRPVAPSSLVIDAKGRTVGQYFFTPGQPAFPIGSAYDGNFSHGSVLTKIGGVWLQLPVSRTGFVSAPSIQQVGIELHFTTSDCSGNGYIAVSDDLAQDATENLIPTSWNSALIIKETLYYPSSPQPCTSIGSFNSWSFLYGDGTASQCYPASSPISACAIGALVGTMSSIDVSTLGFVPPFSLKSLQ